MEGYAFASLGAVDRFFMRVRYALNPLDRARATGQRHGRRGAPQPTGDDKWDVYHPYNPAHVQTHCVAPDAVVPLAAVIGAGGTAGLLYNHPALIVLDNGPELTSKAMFFWAHKTKVKLCFIQPGKPTQNAYVESFNGRFRDGCLNQHGFSSLNDARQIINDWRNHYNNVRPHSSLGYRAPTVFEAEVA